MIGAKIGKRLDTVLNSVATVILRKRFHPNTLTIIGLKINIVAALAFVFGKLLLAGILMLLAGLFDMLDGAVARTSGIANKFGAFFDSVVDRYSDTILLLGIAIYFSRQNRPGSLMLLGVVLLGFILIPYTRAKAETIIPKCDVGLMERAERIIFLSIGSMFNFLPVVLWILAVLTHITVFQRIYFTYNETKKLHGLSHNEPMKEKLAPLKNREKIIIFKRRSKNKSLT